MWGVCIIIPGNGRERRGSCEFDQIELLPPASEKQGPPWQPIFDGKSMDGFFRSEHPVWKIENGALVWDPCVQGEGCRADVEVLRRRGGSDPL